MASTSPLNNVLGAAQTAPAVPSTVPALSIPTVGDHGVWSIPFYATLTARNPVSTMSFHNNTNMRNMFALFESVKLVDMSVSIQAAAGENRYLEACFSTFTTPPANGQYIGAPIGSMFYVTPQIPGQFTFNLPSDHCFGTELKCAVVGNPPPILHVRISGLGQTGDSIQANIRGTVRVRLCGTGVLPAVQVGV